MDPSFHQATGTISTPSGTTKRTTGTKNFLKDHRTWSRADIASPGSMEPSQGPLQPPSGLLKDL